MKWEKNDYLAITSSVILGIILIVFGFFGIMESDITEIILGFVSLGLAVAMYLSRKKSIKMHKEHEQWLKGHDAITEYYRSKEREKNE